MDINCSKCNSSAFEGALRDLFGTELVKNPWSMSGVKFAAYVCSSCGYIELYANNPKSVKKLLS